MFAVALLCHAPPYLDMIVPIQGRAAAGPALHHQSIVWEYRTATAGVVAYDWGLWMI